MKNKIFSSGVYTETLRRLRITGFIVTAVFLVAQIIGPILEYTSVNNSEWYRNYAEFSRYIVSVPEILSMLMIIPYLIVPIMAFRIFGSYNKRKFSDFYHSVPYTRLCVFLSSIAAIMTWAVGIIAVTGVVGVAFRFAFPSLYIVSFDLTVDFILSVIIMSLLTLTGVALGCSFTGTALSNFTASALILVLPRAILEIITEIVSNNLSYFFKSTPSGILSPRFNLLFEFIGNNFEVLRISENIWCYVYSLCLSIVMGIIAALVFVKRRSETAGQSASSRTMQAVIRIALTFLISALGTMVLMTTSDITFAIVIFVIAVFVFFIYEIITTKKAKNLLRILPSLLIVIGLNICVFLAALGIMASESSYCPSASEVSYVRVLSTDLTSYGEYYYNIVGINNFEGNAEDVKITDPEVIECVTDALKYTVNYIQGSESPYYSNSFYVKVAINTGAVTKYRTVIFHEDDYNKFILSLSKVREYTEKYMTLPEREKGTEYFSLNSYEYDSILGKTIYNAELDEIFECLQNEILETGFIKLHSMDVPYDSAGSEFDYDSSVYISYVIAGTRTEYVIIFVPKDVFPDTYKMIYDLYTKYKNSPYITEYAI